MRVRSKKAPAAHKAVNGQPPQSAPAESYVFPAPIRGWVLNENLAQVTPGGARILDNWIPTTTGIRVRRGAVKHATLPSECKALFTYGVASRKMFAATATAIYDVTSPADPNVAPAAAVSGRTSGDYSSAQFGTPGTSALYVVNGADKPLLYDGTTWTAIDGASSPAITGVTTSLFSHVWSYANRLFFVEKNSLRAWFLPVDSIGGAAQSVSMSGIFKKGGVILFGARWSIDAGNGLDDKCVFVSTEGEVAIYGGTNPTSTADWALEGLYQIPRPIGKNATMEAGGELLIATVNGLIPLSAALQNDIGALESKSVSYPISPYWNDRAGALNSPWEIVKIPGETVMYITQPDPVGGTQTLLCANIVTGAWSRITGWNARCVTEFNGVGYYGCATGCVFAMEKGGSDNGTPYTCVYLGQSEGMGSFTATKSVRQMRATFQSGSPINPQLRALADFNETISPPPSSPANYSADLWDVGKWDQARWDSTTTVVNDAAWTAVGVTGRTIAPELQLTFGISPPPKVELVAIEVEFHTGARVT